MTLPFRGPTIAGRARVELERVVSFLEKYPVPLNELLLAPALFRARLPALAQAPLASAAGMRDLAEFAGASPGAFRTAMSRLRASGLVRAQADDAGVLRYTPAGLSRSVQSSVIGQPDRPKGFLLAVFSFAADDARERQVVREALRLHGFQKLAQNAYINGRIDTAGLEALFEREGVSHQVFFFKCEDDDDPTLRRKLASLFDLPARARALLRFQHDLLAFLDVAPAHEFARHFLYAGPAHFRVTWLDEPPLPPQVLPEGYPLASLQELLPAVGARRATDLARYFRSVHV